MKTGVHILLPTLFNVVKNIVSIVAPNSSSIVSLEGYHSTYSWISLVLYYYAVNLGGGQPRLY